MSYMAKLYVNLIQKGLRTIEQVPQRWQDEVKSELAKEQKGNE